MAREEWTPEQHAAKAARDAARAARDAARDAERAAQDALRAKERVLTAKIAAYVRGDLLPPPVPSQEPSEAREPTKKERKEKAQQDEMRRLRALPAAELQRLRDDAAAEMRLSRAVWEYVGGPKYVRAAEMIAREVERNAPLDSTKAGVRAERQRLLDAAHEPLAQWTCPNEPGHEQALLGIAAHQDAIDAALHGLRSVDVRRVHGIAQERAIAALAWVSATWEVLALCEKLGLPFDAAAWAGATGWGTSKAQQSVREWIRLRYDATNAPVALYTAMVQAFSHDRVVFRSTSERHLDAVAKAAKARRAYDAALAAYRAAVGGSWLRARTLASTRKARLATTRRAWLAARDAVLRSKERGRAFRWRAVRAHHAEIRRLDALLPAFNAARQERTLARVQAFARWDSSERYRPKTGPGRHVRCARWARSGRSKEDVTARQERLDNLLASLSEPRPQPDEAWVAAGIADALAMDTARRSALLARAEALKERLKTMKAASAAVGIAPMPTPERVLSVWVEERSQRRETPRMLPRYIDPDHALIGADGQKAMDDAARHKARRDAIAATDIEAAWALDDAAAPAKAVQATVPAETAARVERLRAGIKDAFDPAHETSIVAVSTSDGWAWWKDDAASVVVYRARDAWYRSFGFQGIRKRIVLKAKALGFACEALGIGYDALKDEVLEV